MKGVNAMHTDNLNEFIASKEIPSSDVIIMKDHKILHRFFCGHRDEEKTKEINGNELYWLYSTSKVITCTAAMRLVERGAISIDDPVSKYIPEYAEMKYIDSDKNIRHCEKTMLVRDLFAMRGGLTYNLASPSIKEALSNLEGDADTLTIIRAIAKEPLLFEPGTDFNYSLCHDVLGAVIEVASGMKFSEFLKKEIFEPLGMKDTGFYPNEEQKKRFTDQYRWENNSYVKVPATCAYSIRYAYESGGAGLFSSVNDYILFADALACHGTAYNGYQLLKPETIELMRSNQNDYATIQAKTTSNKGYSYAFGVRTLISKTDARTDAPIEWEFGWDGAAGAYVSIDPKYHVSAFYAQQVLGHTWVYQEVHPVIRDTKYYIAEICK